MDWGDGHYETTALALSQAAEIAVDALSVQDRISVLDAGCGTGNASIAAARRGARVIGVDPATRLVQVARERARQADVDAEFVIGDAMALPFEDQSFERVVAVFSVIFAPDAVKVASELGRVLTKSGVLVLTSWRPQGAIHDCIQALLAQLPEAPPASPPWGDESFLRDTLDEAEASLSIHCHRLAFEGPSPEEWFETMEREHPAWIAIRNLMDTSGADWSKARRDGIDELRRANEDPPRFRTTSQYWLTRLDRSPSRQTRVC